MGTLLLVVLLSAQSGELLDRTLAIVGGQAVTLSDVQTALALGLIEPADGTNGVNAATERLVERTLVLREVERYAPPEPSDAAIEQRLAVVRARAPNVERFNRILSAGGFTETRLRAWLRDDLRIAAYLDQRFASVGAPSDEDVSAFYSARRDEFERQQVTFEQAVASIRERLSGDRRAQLIAGWVDDLRRRTVVVELWKARP